MTDTSASPCFLSAANCGSLSSDEGTKVLAKSIMRAKPVALLMISTKFFGPTDAKGPWIEATINGTKTSNVVGYDHALGVLDMHAYAALRTLSFLFDGEQLEYVGHDETPDGKGFTFAFRFV